MPPSLLPYSIDSCDLNLSFVFHDKATSQLEIWFPIMLNMFTGNDDAIFVDVDWVG